MPCRDIADKRPLVRNMATGGVPQLGGYKYEFVTELPEDLECPVCQLPLKDPVQIKGCGHRLCEICIETILSSESPQCPTDREPISKDMTFLDVACHRRILDAHVRCPNEGCSWKGELRNMKVHEADCPHQPVQCVNTGCEETVLRKDIISHVESTCLWTVMQCAFCSDRFQKTKKKDHLNKCSRYPCTCIQKCGQKNIPRNEMNDHIKKDCPLTVVDCTFAHIGCQEKVQRNGLLQHVQANIESHLNLSSKKLQKLQAEHDGTTNELQELQAARNATEKEINELKTELQLLQTAHNATKTQLIELQATATESHMNLSCEKLQELQAEHTATKTQMNELQAEHAATKIPMEELQAEQDATKIEMEELQATRASTEKELRELRTERVTRKELQLLQTAHDVTRTQLQELQARALSSVRILSISFVFISVLCAWCVYTRKELHELQTQKNVFIWKFTEFEQRLKKAKDGIQTDFFSNSFYTGPYGYKMCVEIDFDGNGDGENTHLSLFVRLERGDYDAILAWPFNQKVVFTLLDQQADQTQRKDKQESFVARGFKTGACNECFGKPTSERNDGWGFPEFISHDDLRTRRYLVDDAFFIQVKVEQSWWGI